MITAIVLAAGLSTRMGQPKQLLPFGVGVVIEHIVSVLKQSPVAECLVITGHAREAVEKRLTGSPVRAVFNTQYATGEMLSSIRVGLQSASANSQAALMVLGDQPALEQSVVDQIIAAYRSGQGSIIVPSYQMRRGHPLLIERRHWKEILDLGERQTLRDFFHRSSHLICHVEVNTPGVLRDMDTPADYQRELEHHLRRLQFSQDQSEV